MPAKARGGEWKGRLQHLTRSNMPEQMPTCLACKGELASDKYDVCFSDETCSEYCLHDRACYRYLLQATVSNPRGRGTCLFLMLNPSTANESKLDPTVTRCKGFAERWDCRKLWVCNLFAVRGTDADVALRHPNPIGPSNDQHIRKAVSAADIIVCAWGGSGAQVLGGNRFSQRVSEVCEMLADAGRTGSVCMLGDLPKHGQPLHPLYAPYAIARKPFSLGRYKG